MIAKFIIEHWCWLGIKYNNLDQTLFFLDKNDFFYLNGTSTSSNKANLSFIVWENNEPKYSGDQAVANVILGANGKFKIVDDDFEDVYLVCETTSKRDGSF